jgi:hypothetical protein
MTPVLYMALGVLVGICGAIVHFTGWLGLLAAFCATVLILIATKGDGSDEP